MNEQIKKFYTGIIGVTPQTVVSETSLIVAKTIMIGNNTEGEVMVVLTIDGAPFRVSVPSMDTKILDHPICCTNIIAAADKNISLQISGVTL